jgi:hypothetical protein
VTPANQNRFFQAKAAGRLTRVEIDRKRTISFSPFWLARITSAIQLFGGIIAVAAISAITPRLFLRPFGWWNLLLYSGIPIIAFAAIAVIGVIADEASRESQFAKAFGSSSKGKDSGSIIDYMDKSRMLRWIHEWIAFAFAFALVPVMDVMSVIRLATISLPGYILLAFVIAMAWFVAFLDGCDRGQLFYLHKPNEYVDVYDDPRSRHWLGVKAGSPTAPAAQQTP